MKLGFGLLWIMREKNEHGCDLLPPNNDKARLFEFGTSLVFAGSIFIQIWKNILAKYLSGQCPGSIDWENVEGEKIIVDLVGVLFQCSFH